MSALDAIEGRLEWQACGFVCVLGHVHVVGRSGIII